MVITLYMYVCMSILHLSIQVPHGRANRSLGGWLGVVHGCSVFVRLGTLEERGLALQPLFHGSPGLDSCTDRARSASCDPGYAPHPPSEACVQCAAGSACAGGSTNPQACGAGYFSGAGQASCTPCPQGMYGAPGMQLRTSEASSCVRCPAGEPFSEAGSTNVGGCSDRPKAAQCDPGNHAVPPNEGLLGQ